MDRVPPPNQWVKKTVGCRLRKALQLLEAQVLGSDLFSRGDLKRKGETEAEASALKTRGSIQILTCERLNPMGPKFARKTKFKNRPAVLCCLAVNSSQIRDIYVVRVSLCGRSRSRHSHVIAEILDHDSCLLVVGYFSQKAIESQAGSFGGW